jgi:hypothetical protein
MFAEKGIILRSAVSDSVKIVLALYPDKKSKEKYRPLVKAMVKRISKNKTYVSTSIAKTWMDVREVYGMISCLQRVASLMEDYYDGTLDLSHVLAEDEDLRKIVATEGAMVNTIEDMFSLATPVKEKLSNEEVKEREVPLAEDDDPLF